MRSPSRVATWDAIFKVQQDRGVDYNISWAILVQIFLPMKQKAHIYIQLET
jgi:hypothetical protein